MYTIVNFKSLVSPYNKVKLTQNKQNKQGLKFQFID